MPSMREHMKQFDVVKVIAIKDDRFVGEEVYDKRAPMAGDVGTILGIYPDAFEVECSDSDGSTIWLTSMYPDELEPVGS
jgi:hypothetical protein